MAEGWMALALGRIAHRVWSQGQRNSALQLRMPNLWHFLWTSGRVDYSGDQTVFLGGLA